MICSGVCSACLPVPKAVGEYIVKEGWDTGPRFLSDATLIYFPAGSHTRYIEGERNFVLDQPCFVLTPPWVAHRYIFDPHHPVRHVFAHFQYAKCPEAALPRVIVEAIPFVPLKQASAVPGFLRHIVNLACLKPERWVQRCSALLAVVLGEIDDLWLVSRQKEHLTEPPVSIARALILLDKYAHEDISIAWIAREVGLTHEHFSRVFIKHLGMSPLQKLNEKRIEKACQLLVQTQETVKEIAFRVGFKREAYFCQVFKKTRGVTPLHYRQQFANPGVQHLALTENENFRYPLNCSFSFTEA